MNNKLVSGAGTLVGCILLSSWPACHEMFGGFMDGMREEVAKESTPIGQPGARSEAASLPAPSASTPAPEPAPSPESLVTILYDEMKYVRPRNSSIILITLTAPTEISVRMESDRDSPFDLDLFTGEVDELHMAGLAISRDPVMVVANVLLGDTDAPPEPPDPNKPVLIFRKQDAYRSYASEWLALPPGKYSLAMDNSESEEPASARLQIVQRPHN
jgi:hypothetical protein